MTRYAIKYGSDIHVADDRETLRKACADLLAKRTFMGTPLCFIEPADVAGLDTAVRSGCKIVYHEK